MLKSIQHNGFINSFSLLSIENVLTQSKRTTFILKRKYEPQLHKKNQKPMIRPRNYIYEFVKNTNIEKRTPIDVVLTKFVEGVGSRGDVLTLKPSYAYNRLILNGLAVYKTPENIIKYAATDTDKLKDKFSSPEAPKILDFLKKLKLLAVVMNKDNPWTIEKWHIRASLRKIQIYVPEDAIELPVHLITGPDLLKENKEFFITLTINNKERINVRCRIHHWSTDPRNRLPYVVDHWNESAEPLFNDERATQPPPPPTQIETNEIVK